MAEERHRYVAQFDAEGVEGVLASAGQLRGSFAEIFQALEQLSRVDPINIGAFTNTGAFIKAERALKALGAAHQATAQQIVENDRRLAQQAKASPEGATLALATAEARRRSTIMDAEAAASVRMAALGRAVNSQLDLIEKRAGEAEKLGRQIGLGRQAQTSGISYAPAKGFGSAQEDRLFQQAIDAERQMLNAQEAKTAAVEKGLTSQVQLRNLDEQIYRAEKRMVDALDKMASILDEQESALAGQRSDMLATDARRQADLESSRLAKQEAEARRRRVADLEVAFGTKPGSAIFSKDNHVDEARIQELLRPDYDTSDTSAIGRLTRTKSKLGLNLDNVNADIAKAANDLRGGLVEEAAGERKLRGLVNQRQGIESEITKNSELLRAARGESAAAARKEAEASSLGFIGRQRGEFALGFKGERDLSYAQQIGQAAKFSVFYGTAYKLLFAFTQTLQATLTEGIAFQQGMTDLAIASGHTKDEMKDLGERLGQTAADAGASPSQGVEIGARSLGLYAASNAPIDEQSRVAEISARVVSRLAVGSKQEPVDLQASIAAITQALGLGAAGQFRVADLDAYLTKRFGVAQGSTFEAVSQSASVGRAAGFSDEQLFALAADLISRTGQTSTAVGGYLAQIFSRGGEGSLTDVAKRYNIDTTQTLAKITQQLSQVYAKATPNQRTEISAAFGRGKIQNAAVALLGDYNEVLDSASGARTGATGAADKQFAERMNNIGGQINLLGGDLKELAHLLGESGILSLLGLGIEALRQTIEVLNSILSIYNQLPAALKDFLGALIAAEIGLRVAGKGGIAGAVGELALDRGIGLRDGVGRVNRLNQLITPYGATAASAEAGAARAAGMGLGATAGVAASALLPVAAVAGAVYALTSVIDTMNKQKAANEQSVAVLGAADGPGVGSAASAYRAQAESLQTAAKAQRDATGWVAQAISFGHANDSAVKTAKQLDKEAQRLNDVADKIDARPSPKETTFASLDDKGIQAGFDQITQSGGTAVEQLKALNEAIHGLGDAALGAKGKIDVGEQATGINKDLVDNVTGFLSVDAVGGGHKVSADKVKKAIRDQLTGGKIQKRLKDELDKLGVTNIGQLTPEQINDLAATISKLDFGSDTSLGKLTAYQGKGLTDKIQKILRDNIVKNFSAQADQLRQIYGQGASISMDEALAGAAKLLESTAANLALLPDSDYKGRAALLKNQLSGLHAEVNKAGHSSPQLNLDIRNTQKALAQNTVAQLEALRKVAVANAKTQKEATAAAAPLIRKEIEAAVKAGDRDLLAQVLSLAGKGAVRIARDVINEAIKAVDEADADRRRMRQAAKAMRAAMAAAISAYQGALAAVPDPWGQTVQPGTVLSPKPKVGPSKKDLKGLDDQTHLTTPADKPDQIPKDSAAADKPTAEEVRAARLAAEAARKGGEIAPARAAVAQALAELHKAKKGTVEYYNALASFYQAQDQLNDALRNYKHIVRELHIDTTDPLAEANLALQTAREKLREDIRRGKGRDVTAQDKLDVKNAQNEQESTAFSQRLEDVQTAEDLGRISHAAYMRYLESEHNRLNAIAHRTRQQQDQLNQVDKLMKDAAGEMAGAFNIGDIKLPTPYEVRRYIKTQVTSTPYALGPNATSGTTTIYINGADTGAVKRIIDQNVGKGTRVLTTTTRRN